MSYNTVFDAASARNNTTGPIYGDYNVPFNGSESYPPNASYVMTYYIWWIPQFEIPFLIIVILLGLIGNASIIGAIILEKKLKFAGNAFIVNLAVADLIVTGYILPGVLTNVITHRNMFPLVLCSVTAYVLSVSCIASMYSLMMVSINRYVAIVYITKYTEIFSHKKIAVMIAGIWIWASIVTMPPAFGWGDYRYHKKIHVCMYDCNAEKYLSFTISYVCISIILPFIVTCVCYYGVFRAFKQNSHKMRKMTQINSSSVTTATDKTKITKKDKSRTGRENRERRLVVTLLAAVTLFTICWLPYALLILINHRAAAFNKRSAAWLAFTNSAMNSILYGALNRNFRNGYKKMWGRIFATCSPCRNLAKRMITNSKTDSTLQSADEHNEAKAHTQEYDMTKLHSIQVNYTIQNSDAQKL